MKIVVYQDEQVQEDGSILRPWMAVHAEKHVLAQGVSAQHALRLLMNWLRSTLDEGDDRTPDLYAIRYYPPCDPEDPDTIPANSEPYTSDHEPPAWVAKVADLPARVQARLISRAPEPVIPDTPDDIKQKFQSGGPYVPEDFETPAGWEVRIYEGV